jgi:hypothetical protein
LCAAAISLITLFLVSRPPSRTRYLHPDSNFTEQVVETVKPSLHY